MAFRKGIYDGYAYFFNPSGEGINEEDQPKSLNTDLSQGFGEHWKWWAILNTLADNKFNNLDYVYGRPIYESLNYLIYQDDRDKVLADKEKQMRNKNKAR